MSNAYVGKILWVDLTKGTCSDEKIPDEVYEKYLTGVGLASYILTERIPPNADPLGPENVLAFMSGLLTATGSLFTGRWVVCAKSPLTKTWGDANCGGTFSPAIKRSGYDGIFFVGKSEKPVYLYIGPKGPELRDAAELWGKDAVETEEILLENYKGKKPVVACIGMAGEKLSYMAGVSNDKGRMAARSGLGAVMGSKKLKAVVLAGCRQVAVHNRVEMKRLSKKCNFAVQLNIPFPAAKYVKYLGVLLRVLPFGVAQDGMSYKMLLRKWGTASMNQVSIEMGDSPIKNWKGSNVDFNFKKSDAVNADVFKDAEKIKYHCYSCPLGCGGICRMKGKYSETHKPEYETVLAVGGLCMNEDPDSIFYMNELLNRAGMDTISAGGTLAFAIECYERGIITKEDTGGLELTWGNTEAIIKLCEMIITREGIGDILADGSRVAAQKLGRDSEKFAIQGGGSELAMHDPRADPGFALHGSVEPAPGRHTIGCFLYYEMFRLWTRVKYLPRAKMVYSKSSKYTADKEKIVCAAATSNYTALFNSLGLCLFGSLIGTDRIKLFEWINAATGWNKTPAEYMLIGERIQTLRQTFNIIQGIDPRTIKVSARAYGDPPLKEGANKNCTVPLDQLMTRYWKQMGYDETGIPLRATLERLSILDVAERRAGQWGA